MSAYSLTRSRTFQYVGILLILAALAAGCWYFAARAGVKTNTSSSQLQGTGDLSAGLAGYWKLDENTGTSAADASTNGNTGTLTNGPTWVTGQIGSAVDFDGTNDYITAGTGDTPIVKDKKTVAAWVYIDGTMTNGTTYQIVRKYSSGDSNTYYGLALYHDGSSTKLMSHQGGGGAFVYSTGAVAAGQWVHVAATFDKPNVSFYINGALDSTGTDTVAGGYPSGSGTMYIGSTNSATGYFNGKLDEVRVYDRPLSADEVSSLYRLTAPTGVDTGLKGYWSFNGDSVSGTNAYDRSGAGNTGTLTNGPTVTDGRAGQAFQFDGTDDYVDLGVSTPYQFANTTFTATGWFKSAPSATGGVFISQGGYIPDGWYVGLDGDTSGRLTATIKNSDGGQSGRLSVQTGFNDNQWHHFAFVITTNTTSYASNSFLIYADGILQSSTANSDSTSGGYATSTYTAKLGTRGPASDAFFNGNLDEVRVYNRALSANEIKSFYDRGSPDRANTSAGQKQGTSNLDSGLFAYFPFDENTGTSTADKSVNANNGTLTNGPTWTTGQIGSAVNFDGTNDHVSFATKIPRKGTISAWVNTTEALSLCTYSNVFAAETPGSHVQLQFNSCSVGYNHWELLYRGSYGTYADVAGPTYTSTSEYQGWHHLTATWDDAVGATLYIDGALAGSSTTTTGAVDDATATTGYLGSFGGVQDYYSGKIDETRLYDRILSADEVAQLYRLTAPTGVDTSLKGYWSFNGQDISGTTAYDRSGAGNNGTITNSPAVKGGRVGQAFDFFPNGSDTDAYITMGDPSSGILDFGSGDFSVGFWMKGRGYSSQGSSANIPLAKKPISSPNSAGYAFLYDSTNTMSFFVGNGTTDYYATATVATTNDNQWHHYYGVRSGSAMSFYIDGVVVDTETPSGSVSNSSDFVIGTDVSDPSARNANALIDEVRIYSRALTAAEIKSLYDASAPDKTNTSVSTPQGTGRLDSGLAGYWKLDEGSGTSAADASTNGFTGTLTNGPTWTTGQIGSAVDFDGTDDYISLGTTLVSADSITVAAWVKGDAAVDGMPIIGQINGEEGSNHQCLLYDNTGTENLIFGSSGTGGYVSTQVTGLGTTWHHVVYTNQGTTNSIYLDGTKIVESSSSALTVNTESNITIGRCWSGGGASYFNGLIDDVRIYRRTLSADEVGQLYRLGTPTGTDTGLKGYWSFNGQDMSGTTAYDRSGAGNDGTLTGGPAVKWGKLGQALQFDGTDDYIALGDYTTEQTLYSVAFWVNQTGSATGSPLMRGNSGGCFYNPRIDVDSTSVTFAESGCSSTGVIGSATLSSGWRHVVVTRNGSSAKLYIDGVLVPTTGTPQSPLGTTGGRFAIGAQWQNDTNYGNFLNTKLDEVRVYNRELSASEIKALYSSGK